MYGAVALVLIALTIWLEDSVLGFEEDVVRLFDFVSPAVERMLHGALEWVSLCISARSSSGRWRRDGSGCSAYVAVAYAVAGGLMWLVLQLLDRADPTIVVNEVAERAGLSGATTSGEIGFAQFAAAFVVVGPFVSTRWRRAGAIALAVLVLMRFIVGYYLPGNVVVSIPVGATIGAAVLLAFGRPDRRPTMAAIGSALANAGSAGARRCTRPPSTPAARRRTSRRSTTARACSSRCSASPSGRPT